MPSLGGTGMGVVVIVLKALAGALFAAGVVAAAIIIVAFLIQTVRFLTSDAYRWYKRIRRGKI